MTRALLRWLDQVDTERRRHWAASLLIVSIVGWLLSHVGLVIAGQSSFFEHVVMGISWLAISFTAADIVVTSDVRDQQE